MSNNVLVIGNGFDLAHGRKTQYMDFMRCIFDAVYQKRGPGQQLIVNFPDCLKSSLLNLLINEYRDEFVIENWIDFEKELSEMILRLVPFLDSFKYHSQDNTYRNSIPNLKDEERLLSQSLISIFTIDDRILKMRPEFISVWKRIDKDRVFVQIEKELTELSKMFEYYLIHIEPALRGELIPLELIRKIEPSYVISFNYTDTVESLYGVTAENICYIHGKIKKNNIVFGYNDDAEEYLEDLMFKKYYRRLVNHTDTIKFQKLYRLDGGFPVKYTMHFFGHSLSISDKDILLQLFSKGNRICIYCRNEFERAQRISNIIQIIGKEHAVSKIQSGEISFEFIGER